MEYITPIAKAYARKLPSQLYSTWDKELLPRLYAVMEDGYTVLTSKPSVESVLPLVISLLLIYATVISLYNTARFVIRTLLFLLKWTVIVSVVVGVIQLSSSYTGKDISAVAGGSTWSLLGYLSGSAATNQNKKSRHTWERNGRRSGNKPRKSNSKSKEDVNELINNIINYVLG